MLTQEQYSRVKTSIESSKSIEQVVTSLADVDTLYLKGRWDSSRVCLEAQKANDALAVKLYCLAEFQICVLYAYAQLGDMQHARMAVMQHILMQHMRRGNGFNGF